jgi:serine/threonine protein kinase
VYRVWRLFEAAWRAVPAGPRPRIEDYISEVPEPGRLDLLGDLLCLDVAYRRLAGEQPAPEDYLSQFPDQAELIHEAISQPPTVVVEPPVATGSAPEPLPNVPGYEVLERIGWGGMGVVWRCRDHVLPRYLAMKTLKEKYRKDANFSTYCCRLQREARVLGELQHPGIVPIYQSGTLPEPDGRPFFVMKLVKGRTLAQLLAEQGHRAARWLRVFEAVCQAVAYAHSQDVIHRDLKPANVMVGAFGEVQVMDWGLAKVLPWSSILGAGPMADCPPPSEWPEDATRTYAIPDESDDYSVPGSIMGTWEFMPPEQARGLSCEADKRSDVFGLGAFLCAILTGQPPYVGPTPEDVIRQARAADLAGAYARLEASGTDADLIKLAKRCLAVEPDDRPQDAGEVATAVAAYLVRAEERAQKAAVAQLIAQEKEAGARREQELAEKAWWRMLWLAVGLFCTLLALVAASLFAWQAHGAELARLAAELDREAEKVARLAAERDREAEKVAREAEKRQSAIDRALTAAMGGDLKGAEQAIGEAHRAGASRGQLEMLRGQIALHRGESHKAMGHLEEAVEKLPDSVAARGLLAAAYAWDGHWEKYDRTIRAMAQLTPSTPEDFLFKGYAEANLDPTLGLQTMQKAFDLRPMMGVALLLRAEVRAFVAQDTDNLTEAAGAVQDAGYARELLRNNAAALCVSIQAHLAKAGVHEHRNEPEQRREELKLAGNYAEELERFTKPATLLPEAVVNRWLYFREMGRAEEVKVLEELRRASEQTDHVYVTFCYALTLYRRGKPGDFEEALRVLEKPRALDKTPGSYNDRLLPFVLAEHDWPGEQGLPGKYEWPDRARKASDAFAAWAKDGMAVMDARAVFCLLGKKEEAVAANKELPQEWLYSLRSKPFRNCLSYNTGKLSADGFIREAKDSRWDQCVAHYYVAMMKLAEGDREGAREHFDKVVKTRAFIWGPYDMSWVFLNRLEKDPTWPPWIRSRQAK